MTTPEDEAPKIHVDSDWKAQAQAEKERLASAEQEMADRPRPGQLPNADFRALMSVLASQAIMGLGAVGDPKTGRVVVDLPGSQFSIDLLDVLEQKTKGNLSDEEAAELKQITAELRARFVELSQLVARQQAAAGAPPTPGGEGGDPPLITP